MTATATTIEYQHQFRASGNLPAADADANTFVAAAIAGINGSEPFASAMKAGLHDFADAYGATNADAMQRARTAIRQTFESARALGLTYGAF